MAKYRGSSLFRQAFLIWIRDDLSNWCSVLDICFQEIKALRRSDDLGEAEFLSQNAVKLGQDEGGDK